MGALKYVLKCTLHYMVLEYDVNVKGFLTWYKLKKGLLIYNILVNHMTCQYPKDYVL